MWLLSPVCLRKHCALISSLGKKQNREREPLQMRKVNLKNIRSLNDKTAVISDHGWPGFTTASVLVINSGYIHFNFHSICCFYAYSVYFEVACTNDALSFVFSQTCTQKLSFLWHWSVKCDGFLKNFRLNVKCKETELSDRNDEKKGVFSM